MTLGVKLIVNLSNVGVNVACSTRHIDARQAIYK